MMKKIFYLSLFLFLVVGLGDIFAATGPASVYKVTIAKFEIYNGSSWITAFEGTSTAMDIASVNAGESVGNFFSGLDVPDGNYTQVKVTTASTFTISGNNGTVYTTAAKAGTPAGCVPTGAVGNEAECVVDVSVGAATPDVLPATLVVTNGIPSHIIRVNFDVSNAIEDQGGNLYPAAAVVTMTMVEL